MDDFADETTLDAIGFQKNESGFHRVCTDLDWKGGCFM
jgi:hypothetical protein